VTGPATRAPAAMDWAALMNNPAAYIDLTRLAACFNGHISLGLCGRMRDTARLQDRLSALITDFYGLAAPLNPETLNPVDQKVALLPAAAINGIIRRAGAIYWANAIANVVRAEEVRWLRGRLGETLYTFALSNRSFSGPATKLALTDAADARIIEDGTRCLGAWCQSQPAAIGERMRLKGPASPVLDGAVQSPFNELGPAIIRCATA
jgi:hypothetical protein